MHTIVQTLSDKIKSGAIIPPSLFLGVNKEILGNQVQNIASELSQVFEIPKQYIFTLEDNGEKIKIAEMKRFLEISHSHPGYPFQIFIIENIARLTLASANSCLKFFEEPGKHNVIFLTNNSESQVLDTILSRVNIQNMGGEKRSGKNEFYYSLLSDYDTKKSHEIFSYFFRNKLEKEEYISFLENLLLYATKNNKWISLLEELDEDISAIKTNNVNVKYIVDKYLLKLG